VFTEASNSKAILNESENRYSTNLNMINNIREGTTLESSISKDMYSHSKIRMVKD
jgi:hypothetical protein